MDTGCIPPTVNFFQYTSPFWGQGLIPEAVNEVLRYAFENLRQTAVWCGYFDGNEKSKRVQEKCGFTYSHTEHNKPAPLMNDFRTEHFTKITLDDWRLLDHLRAASYPSLTNLYKKPTLRQKCV